MQDIIRKEIFINASQEIIYKAIADPEQVTSWFPSSIEGRYEVGQQPILGFGERGKTQIYIVDAKPHHYFAYRWVPGANHFLGDVLSVETTLVEFNIEPQGESCKVTLTETGFSQLPVEIMEDSFNQNSGGWDFMLARLVSNCEEN